MLYNNELTPLEIFFLRFVIAYICIWFISPRQLLPRTWHDELIMVLLGITGGSVFFLAENYVAGLTYVSNVSFIVCITPLFTVLIGVTFMKSIKASWLLVLDSLIASMGVAIVIFNGSLVLHLNPWDDLLTLLTPLCQVVYSLLTKKISNGYSAVFIIRKVFSYGPVTVLPAFLFDPWTATTSMLLAPKVILNPLFLGLVTSFLCFVLWTLATAEIGTMTSSSYLYLNPITTVAASAIFLNEPMTAMTYVGNALILIDAAVSNE